MMIKKRRERERIKSAIKKVEKQEWRHINGEKKKVIKERIMARLD